jgi:hypothetical protein
MVLPGPCFVRERKSFGVGRIVDLELGSQYSLEKIMVMLNVAILHYIISDMLFRTNLQSISFLLFIK